MTLLEDVRSMQSQGMQDEQVIQTLRNGGANYRDIADALTQSKIKVAVEENTNGSMQGMQQNMADAYSQESGMQPSILNQPQLEQIPDSMQPQQQQSDYYSQAPSPSQSQQYNQGQEYVPYPEQQTQYDQQNYPQYQSPVSADLISEISEQVVAEKLSEIRKHLEKIIDLKTTFESKIEYMDERLKRLEKTIDTLQSSVLRKVGDYVTNVQDLKSELVATQKTFDKLTPNHSHQNNNQHKHNQHSQNSQHHNSQHHQHKK